MAKTFCSSRFFFFFFLSQNFHHKTYNENVRAVINILIKCNENFENIKKYLVKHNDEVDVT